MSKKNKIKQLKHSCHDFLFYFLQKQNDICSFKVIEYIKYSYILCSFFGPSVLVGETSNSL